MNIGFYELKNDFIVIFKGEFFYIFIEIEFILYLCKKM